MDWYLRKLVYVWLKFSEYTINSIVFCYSILYNKKKKTKDFKSIGAFWYYPPDLTGSNLRIGGWRKYFIDDGYVFDDFFNNELNEYVKNIENGSWSQKYYYFSLCMWRRLPQLIKAHRYDVLWIDRSLIPFYPRKSAFLERCLNRVVSRIVVDSTDGGDYLGNPKLMEDVYRNADKITVGYQYLLQEFEKKYTDVTQVYWTIPDEKYIKKNNYSIGKKPVVGWMGSPGNFNEVLKIKEALATLNKLHPFTFRYICRENFDLQLKGIDADHYKFGDDYYSLIASFDIGISPFMTRNMRTMGKIAMKHQEFLLTGTPQVCSPVAISEFVKNEQHAVIAYDETEWVSCIEKLFHDEDLRINLGTESKLLFDKKYNYTSQYEKLKTALIGNQKENNQNSK